MFVVQRLELQKNNTDDNENVRGQIVISLISRDRGGSGPSVTDAAGILNIRDPNELPEGYDLLIFNMNWHILHMVICMNNGLLHLCQDCH